MRGPRPMAGGCVGAWMEAREAATSAAACVFARVCVSVYNVQCTNLV
jgi:hypothetical protein